MNEESKTPSSTLTTATGSSDSFQILRAEGMNNGAAAATLSYISDTRMLGLLDKWTEIPCSDGSKALVLKDPSDAFELYAKEWTTKFNVVLDILNQIKANGSAEVSDKVVKLFDNLNYVNAALQEMYKNSYLTFAATPCSESSQKEKRSMDRIIAAIGLSLVSIKIILDSSDGKNIDGINDEVLKLIDRIIVMIENSMRSSTIPTNI